MAILTLVTAAWMVATLVAGGWAAGLRINTTPSEPLGLWRIVPLSRELAVGAIVFVCLPNNPAMKEARRRGYLRSGLCSGFFGPLIKTVIAAEGQHVLVTDQIIVDGVAIANSGLLDRDGKGRVLPHAQSMIVPAGEIFLNSGFKGSWDSRYFGTVPAAGVLGLASEVLTYAP